MSNAGLEAGGVDSFLLCGSPIKLCFLQRRGLKKSSQGSNQMKTSPGAERIHVVASMAHLVFGVRVTSLEKSRIVDDIIIVIDINGVCYRGSSEMCQIHVQWWLLVIVDFDDSFNTKVWSVDDIIIVIYINGVCIHTSTHWRPLVLHCPRTNVILVIFSPRQILSFGYHRLCIHSCAATCGCLGWILLNGALKQSNWSPNIIDVYSISRRVFRSWPSVVT